MKKRQSFEQKEYGNKSQQAQELEQIEGHPLYTLTKENQALLKLLQQFAGSEDENLLSIIGQFAVHYAKKGDLLYPHLKVTKTFVHRLIKNDMRWFHPYQLLRKEHLLNQ